MLNIYNCSLKVEFRFAGYLSASTYRVLLYVWYVHLLISSGSLDINTIWLSHECYIELTCIDSSYVCISTFWICWWLTSRCIRIPTHFHYRWMTMTAMFQPSFPKSKFNALHDWLGKSPCVSAHIAIIISFVSIGTSKSNLSQTRQINGFRDEWACTKWHHCHIQNVKPLYPSNRQLNRYAHNHWIWLTWWFY